VLAPARMGRRPRRKAQLGGNADVEHRIFYFELGFAVLYLLLLATDVRGQKAGEAPQTC